LICAARGRTPGENAADAGHAAQENGGRMTAARKSRTRTQSRQRPSGPRTLYLVRTHRRRTRTRISRRQPASADQSGHRQDAHAARGFADLDPEIDVVFPARSCEPQTAEILLAELDPAPVHELLEELSPGYSPADLAEALGATRNNARSRSSATSLT
jgi:hypothetical protein